MQLTLELKAPRLLKPVRAAITGGIKRLALPDGRLAEAIGLRVNKGYNVIMGIPKDHFAKMVEAAKEAKGIAVFARISPRPFRSSSAAPFQPKVLQRVQIEP